jgi:hemolysin activation/secretion protein
MAHATVQSLNLWGIGHILTVNGSSAFNGELWGASAAYMLPRMDNGKWWDWNWTFHGGYTKVDEEEAVSGRRADGSKYRLLDVDGEGYFGGLQISKRLVDTGRSTLDLSLGVTYRYVESGVEIWDADGGHQHYAYGHHTRNAAGVDDVDEGYYIVPASIALMYSETAIDSFGGRNYATVEGVHSLDTAGENRLKGFRYTIEGDDYWLARAQLARIQLLGDWNYSNASGLYSVFARADGQYTSDALVSAEQFAAGGHNSVRGYKERQFLGDSGASATVELRTPIYAGIFHRDAVAGTMPLDRWQFLAFADAGYFSLKDGKSANENDENLIYSIGAGFRLALGDHWQMRCDLGVPLEKKGSKDKSTGEKEEYDIDSCRLHLSLQAQW